MWRARERKERGRRSSGKDKVRVLYVDCMCVAIRLYLRV